MEAFKVVEARNKKVPIIVSVPHCGTQFPNEIRQEYDQSLIQSPDDTDWFVDQLYGFVSEMGITMIKSVYSRWVIDLNRDPESKPLYSDGRIITDLVPTTTFKGEKLYVDQSPTSQEVERRVEKYYRPYHDKLQSLIEDLKQEFGKVLLWEAHSIRQFVPTIHPEKFPDLILGNADSTTCDPSLIDIAVKRLSKGGYSFSHNHPFKGGYITRHFGDPENNVNALQLEMTKVNYMGDDEITFDEQRANKMRDHLKSVFEELIIRLL
ncbi:MAG: N-formylglutamate amidohydrolase [Cyclobacteriaceae bacterium]